MPVVKFSLAAECISHTALSGANAHTLPAQHPESRKHFLIDTMMQGLNRSILHVLHITYGYILRMGASTMKSVNKALVYRLYVAVNLLCVICRNLQPTIQISSSHTTLLIQLGSVNASIYFDVVVVSNLKSIYCTANSENKV